MIAIPSKIFFTDGKGAERPFVDPITSSGQTVAADRGYQKHTLFDSLQTDGKSFVIRIKAKTTKTIVQKNETNVDSIVFYDAEVQLGTEGNKNQSQTPVRLVGYHVGNADYWIATDRRDLTAEQIAEIYKLRWNIENFFAWWKRHLRVYHLIARSPYGLMVQILSGLITYLLLAIHCHENHGEPVTINRVKNYGYKSKMNCVHQEDGIQNQIFSKNKINNEYKQKPNRTLLNKIQTISISPLNAYVLFQECFHSTRHWHNIMLCQCLVECIFQLFNNFSYFS